MKRTDILDLSSKKGHLRQRGCSLFLSTERLRLMYLVYLSYKNIVIFYTRFCRNRRMGMSDIHEDADIMHCCCSDEKHRRRRAQGRWLGVPKYE